MHKNALKRNGFCYEAVVTKGDGARGRSRTDTGLPPLDFESSTSTSFITRAMINPFNH